MSDPSSAHKPMWLTTAEKRNVEMGPGGWVRKAGTAMTGSDDTSGDPEILVAFRGSGGITGWISSFRFTASTQSAATPAAISVDAYFSENVDVTGSPTVTITNTGTGSAATVVCTYASGTGTDVIRFTSSVPGAGDLDEDDILNIGANATALAGGTIKDAGTATVTTITNTANQGNAGGVVTGGNYATTAAAETDGPRLIVAA